MSVSQEQKLQSTFTVEEAQEIDLKQTNTQLAMLNKDFKRLVKLLRNNPKSRLDYPKLKYQGNIYTIGQNISITSNTKMEYVAKIIKIINLVDDDDICIPLIKVQWYIRKNELKNIPQDQLDCISENEVFKTHEMDYVEIDSILGMATILSYGEYDAIETLHDHTYFTRAQYQNKLFNPPFNQWPRTCLCRRPPNPDLKYILCDVCQEWCHLQCVDLSMQRAAKISTFICKRCNN